MKKTFIGLFAGSLLTGVLAVSAPAATAATVATAGPYTGTVPTKTATVVPNRVKANKKVKVKVKIVGASTQTARGTLIIKAKNKKTGKLVKKVTFKYVSTRALYPIGKLPKGNYKIITKFIPNKKSVFRRSSSFAYTRVI